MEHGRVDFPQGMDLDVQLAAGDGARLLKLRAWRPEEDPAFETAWPEPRPRDVVSAFVGAVDHGLFRGPAADQRAEVLHAMSRVEQDQRIDEWEIMTPPLDPAAFVALARMFWAAGTRGLTLAENSPPARLTLRSLDAVPPPTSRKVPWEIEKLVEDEAKNAVVLVCFERDAPPDIVRATHAALRAWASVVALGGFSGGPGSPRSAALLSELGTELATEVFARFDALIAGPDAWAALWEGLARIHRQAPIQRVEAR